MDILAHYDENLFKSLLDNPSISKIVAPVIFDPSSIDYANMITHIHSRVLNIARETLKDLLEQADIRFRNSPDRTQRYYVKQTRNRTITTLFGEVTFKRTEYIDKQTKKSFVYVDEKIGLIRRQRYDSVVCSLIYEAYSNSNSMIKVGQTIGDMIHPFSIEDDRSHNWIPRQTVQNICLRFKNVKAPIEPVEETPEDLYIMADEKYISLQREDRENNPGYKGHIKAENRLAVMFTGRKNVSTGRYELTGKHIFALPEDQEHFWDHILEDLDKMFDLKKIKNIYIMGDGAQWIRAGVNALKTPIYRIKYAADRFHIDKYIHKITNKEEYRKKLHDYAYNCDKKDFMKMTDKIKSERNCSEETYNHLVKYVLNQLEALKVMNKEVKFGCSMEQAIQHILASNFTSVPKAYARKNLPTYVNARVAQQNHTNMRLLYLKAQDEYNRTGNSLPDFSKERLDFSIFDSSKTDPYYHFNLKDRNSLGDTRK